MNFTVFKLFFFNFRRRKECSAGGVNECDGIAGCCPEHFDIVFGAGVYLESDNQ